jgi:hypothetical protein
MGWILLKMLFIGDYNNNNPLYPIYDIICQVDDLRLVEGTFGPSKIILMLHHGLQK